MGHAVLEEEQEATHGTITRTTKENQLPYRCKTIDVQCGTCEAIFPKGPLQVQCATCDASTKGLAPIECKLNNEEFKNKLAKKDAVCPYHHTTLIFDELKMHVLMGSKQKKKLRTGGPPPANRYALERKRRIEKVCWACGDDVANYSLKGVGMYCGNCKRYAKRRNAERCSECRKKGSSGSVCGTPCRLALTRREAVVCPQCNVEKKSMHPCKPCRTKERKERYDANQCYNCGKQFFRRKQKDTKPCNACFKSDVKPYKGPVRRRMFQRELSNRRDSPFMTRLLREIVAKQDA